MYVYIPQYWFVYLGIVGLILMLCAPTPSAYRAERRELWQRRRAEWAAWKAQRKAWRRRVFGSHPVLYGALFWLAPPAFVCLIAALTGH